MQKTLLPNLAFVGLSILVLVSYVYMASAGRMTSLPYFSHFHEMQADAFMQGQTALLVNPDPALLVKENPYDHRHLNLWLWDAVLYKDKYYIYWGPVPALVVVAIKTIFNIERLQDQHLGLAFSFLRWLFTALVLLKVYRILAPIAFWPFYLGMMVLAWGNPFPYLLGRMAVYETAIIAGQFLVFCGVYAALLALTATGTKRQLSLLSATGLVWGLALGCRLSLLPAVFGMSAVTMVFWAKNCKNVALWHRDTLVAIGAMGAPIAICLGLLAAFNFLRFGDPLETGQYYQLSMTTLRPTMGLEYLPANIYNYFFRPIFISKSFPFLTAPAFDKPMLPAFIPLPKGYLFLEPIAGIGWASPFNFFVLPIAATIAQAVSNWRRDIFFPNYHFIFWWLLLCLSVLFALAIAPLLVYLMPTMRYVGDLGSALTIIATLGLLTLSVGRTKYQLVLKLFAGALAGFTCILGCLLWTKSAFRFLETHNPDLMRTLTEFFQG